ncbi:MAG: hypothetical protein Tsb0034_15310 [Ekhidna sp.]
MVLHAQDTTATKKKGVDIFITQSPKIIIKLDETKDNTCFGDKQGEINITPSGGYPPYNYFWSHGATTQDVADLPAGKYRVAVYDGFSCSDTLTIEIKQPKELKAEVKNIDHILCYGYNQGAIDIEVTGGTEPYSFNWSNGAKTEDLTNIVSGEYSVLVTDANGCQDIVVGKVEERPLIVRSIDDLENIKCYGDETGRVDISVEGGIPPYSYSWSNGATTEDLENMPAGTYEVTVTDSKGCTEVYSAKVEQPELLIVEIDEVRNVRCYGDEGGAINIRVAGGVQPYKYRWSNGKITQDLSGVKAGSYSVEVQDANGCIQNLEAVITQPENLTVSLVSSNDVSFNGGNDGSIDIQVTGGVTPYKFKWNNDATTEDIENLEAGDYFARVTDATGCSKIINVTIEQPRPLSARFDRISNVKCYGDETGEITVSVIGGIKPYQYEWNNGATTEDIFNLPAGEYSLKVTDANNHSFSIDTLLTQPDEFVGLVESVTNIECFNDKAGGVDITVSGGVAPYKYYWSNGMITQDIVDVRAGSYSVKIVDANRCEIELSAEIVQPEELIVALQEVTNVTCHNETTGSITIETTGGTAPYTYLWSNEATTQNLENVGSGGYDVVVTDANGCTQRVEARITQPEPLVIREEQVENIDCFGNNNGLINLAVTGGTLPYSYSWNTGDTTKNLSDLTVGDYSMTVTDANGCTASYSNTLTTPSELVVSLENTVNNLCFGENDGEININVEGGVAPYRYKWNTGATTQDIVNLKSGEYSVEVTDANGCVDTLSASISEPEFMDIVVESENILCNGESTGSINLTVTGGVTPYTYEWSNGATTQDIANISVGQYSVIVKDANGCTDIRDVNISEPPRFIAILESETQIACYGQSTGAINVRVSGGVKPYTYEWNNGATTEDILDIPAGAYELKVTDANGCQEMVQSTITQPSEVKYTINKVTDLNCFQDNGGAIDISITGGVGPYTYLWSNGATTQDLINVPAGKYSVQITEGNGCQNTLEAEIKEPPLLELKLDTVGHVLCNGDNSGLIKISVRGGVPPYEYSWSNGEVTDDISNLTAGNYSITVTDAHGCMKSASTTVREPRPFAASLLSVQNIKCNGENTGSIKLNVTGGVTPYKFEWSNGATSQNLDSLAAGDYSVKITDANGCVQNLNTVITQPELLKVELVEASDVSCFEGTNGMIDIKVTGGTTPYQYQWSNGALTQDLNGVPKGTYQVIVTDANGCANRTIEVTLAEPPLLQASFGNIEHIDTYGLSSGSIDINVNGGVPPYTYSWSNGATSEDIGELPAGNYSVLVADSHQCEVMLETKINQPPKLNVRLASLQNILCSGDTTGFIRVAVEGGVPPYQFNWSNGDSTQNLENIRAGDYSLTVVDSKAHRKVLTAKINEPSPINVSVDNVKHVLCQGDPSGAVTITVTGGIAPYRYRWSNGATSKDLQNLPAGAYTFTVTDSNGCEQTADIRINEPDELVAQITSLDNIKCNGDYKGAIRLDVTGGQQPYRFRWSNGERTQNIEEVAAGEYSVKIQDANGCSRTLSATIAEPPALVAQVVDIEHNACYADEQGAVSLNVFGGAPPYSYLWSNGDSTQNIAGLSAGSYDVIVRDSLGCEQRLVAEVNQPEELLAEVDEITHISCNGDTEGKIEVSIIGGSSPYRYVWSNGQSQMNLSGVGAGEYQLTIYDANECTYSLSAEVTEPPALVLELDTVQHNLCKNDRKGLIDITVSGGVTPYEYTWSNGEKSEDLVNVIADSYTVLVKDANGCTQEISAEVLEPQLLTVIIDSVSHVTCFGDETGYLEARAAGGNGPYSFEWSNGSTGPYISDVLAGEYEVIVTDQNGCQSSVNGLIEQPVEFVHHINAITDIQCYGDSTGAIYVTAMEGVPPYTFEWSNGATTRDITNVKAGDYRLKITQGNGCISYLDATIEQPDLFDYEIVSITDVNCYGDTEGAIDIDIIGGVEPYTVAWSNGATTEDLEGVPADNYSAIVTDANGCLLTINATIEQPTKLELVIDSVRNVKCCGDTSGAIFISVSGGNPPYKYEWSNGATTQDITNLALGKYTVTVTDASGCEVTSLEEGQLDLYEQVVTTGKFVTRGIQFDVASAVIKSESFRIVNKIATLMKQHPDLTFRIEGHTDSDGSAEFNLKLSQERARSIKQALIKFGISENRLQTQGWGESKPIASNATQAGKQENRRVEFISLTGNLQGGLELINEPNK